MYIYCLSCTKKRDLPFSGGNYPSKPGRYLLYSSTLWTLLYLPKVPTGWDGMRVLKKGTWHPDQPRDLNPFVSFRRLIRQGFTDSILALISLLGITEIGNCIWKSWFIQFLGGTFIQFALWTLKCETGLRSALCYSLTNISSDGESICLW